MGLPLWVIPENAKPSSAEAQSGKDAFPSRSTIRRSRSARGREHRTGIEERSRRVRDAVNSTLTQPNRFERSQTDRSRGFERATMTFYLPRQREALRDGQDTGSASSLDGPEGNRRAIVVSTALERHSRTATPLDASQNPGDLLPAITNTAFASLPPYSPEFAPARHFNQNVGSSEDQSLGLGRGTANPNEEITTNGSSATFEAGTPGRERNRRSRQPEDDLGRSEPMQRRISRAQRGAPSFYRWANLATSMPVDLQPATATSSFTTDSVVSTDRIGDGSPQTSMTTVATESNPVCDFDFMGEDRELPDTETDESLSNADWNARHRSRFTSSRAREDESQSPTELPDMQRIIRRLASREDIPDDWWASAGLSRMTNGAESLTR